jgi:membrane fusion protein, heavy metal efflux system
VLRRAFDLPLLSLIADGAPIDIETPRDLVMNSIWSKHRRWITGVVTVLAVGAAAQKREIWWPPVNDWVQSTVANRRKPSEAGKDDHAVEVDAAGHDDHAGHGHDGHSETNSLELSAQAMANVGLTPESLRPIALQTFHRMMTVPGIVVERPGRTRIEVSTPMAGVITKVFAVEGEAIQPGTPLFDIRITAEELVDSQTELLKTLGDLDVELKEITRITTLVETGAVPQKTLLERQYAKEKLKNLLIAQREALRLHGLSESQIEDISKHRKLFRELRIVAPAPGMKSTDIQLTRSEIVPASYMADNTEPMVALVITTMPVHLGQTVASGTTLAQLVDYSELAIEGRAFERDAGLLSAVTKNKWRLSVLFEGTDQRQLIEDLELIYSSNEIHVDSRTLSFYVRLPNEIVQRGPSSNGHEFVEWKHRPGRRVQLLVPVEELKEQIVLPVEGVAREGAESYVFQQNGGHFDRIAVNVKYRDERVAVIANDGAVFPGDVVARTGAHQMQMALKNKSGGGVDPHAGHNH